MRPRLYLWLIPLGLLIAWSLASGAASVFGWLAERELSAVPGPGAMPGDHVDGAVRAALSQALALEPGSPVYRQRLGEHLERLALSSGTRSSQGTALVEEAGALYRSVALDMPTWPLALTPLLRTEFKLGRLDSGFGALYQRAADLGRFEPAAARALANLGLLGWPLWDAETRASVTALLGAMLLAQPDFVIDRAVAFGRVPVVLPLVAGDPRLAAALNARAGAGPRQ